MMPEIIEHNKEERDEKNVLREFFGRFGGCVIVHTSLEVTPSVETKG